MGGSSQKTNNRQLPETIKVEEMDSAMEPAEGTSPTDALISDLRDSFQISGFQNRKGINLCYFKSLYLVICYNSHKKLIQRIF